MKNLLILLLLFLLLASSADTHVATGFPVVKLVVPQSKMFSAHSQYIARLGELPFRICAGLSNSAEGSVVHF